MRLRGIGSVTAVAVLGIFSLSSCAADVETGEQPQTEQTVSVFAAASLALPFEEIIEDFEALHDGAITVTLQLDGSSTLALQIIEGAPADVFASANERNMNLVSDEDLTVDPQLFTSNTLVIAMPEGNPAGVESLADLSRVTTVLCAPEVPCGNASVQLFEAAGIEVEAASLEQNVTAVLQKVVAGEADAGIVYATDVMKEPSLESIVPEEAADIVNRYPITVLKDAAYPDAAQAFVDYVLGDEGQAVLKSYGFGGN